MTTTTNRRRSHPGFDGVNINDPHFAPTAVRGAHTVTSASTPRTTTAGRQAFPPLTTQHTRNSS